MEQKMRVKDKKMQKHLRKKGRQGAKSDFFELLKRAARVK